jgi:hypothetical protein
MPLFKVTVTLPNPCSNPICRITDAPSTEEAQSWVISDMNLGLDRFYKTDEFSYKVEPHTPTLSGTFWVLKGRLPIQRTGEVVTVPDGHLKRIFREVFRWYMTWGDSKVMCQAGVGEDVFATEAEANAIELRILRAQLAREEDRGQILEPDRTEILAILAKLGG